MKQTFIAKYYLNQLELKKGGNNVDRISATLLNSKIKLTPHQISASLFSFKSPISKGVILADEVGLGKTIEAGIIIAQLWFEKKARVLIISPASLMRQWNVELYDKFSLNSEIMDRKLYKLYQKKGYNNPFKNNQNIIICSYQFASINHLDIKNGEFDTIIIDEAHKLRNVYNEKNTTANNIKIATEKYKKILLTATPIQNSMMDLYGLASFIDDNIFGDKDVFRNNYIKNFNENEEEMKIRLSGFLHRTLRNQVSQYIKFTNRIAKTFSFSQSEAELEIYNELRDIIMNPDSNKYIIPNKQKHLFLLILSKLMGSSIYALEGTLKTILQRLKLMHKNEISIDGEEIIYENILDDDFELSEFYNDSEDKDIDDKEKNIIDTKELNAEINKIEKLLNKISKISTESKYYSLLESLNYSFNHLREMGANKKVLIFTESRRTQEFLYKRLLEDTNLNILIFNGNNNDEKSNLIFDEWINRPENSDKKDNSKNLNMRTAIIDEFRNNGDILIATEAGAEGLNLQFCSLVINYDLPWNPQRVEQRIGRCHRFGQKHDVTVINFINESNMVEKRIYNLLSEKFCLFDEVFGTSDEILGKLDNVEDLQKSISDIYSNCRTPDEIDNAFNELQKKYDKSILETIEKTKESIINNFEEDIQSYFKETMLSTEISLDNIELLFWNLSKSILDEKAIFNESDYTVSVKNLNTELNGEYKLSSRNMENKFIDFNINSKLGRFILEEAHKITKTQGKIIFDVTNYPYNLKQVENLINKQGIISVNKIIVDSFETEEFIIINAALKDGTIISEDIILKLFRVSSSDINNQITNIELKELIKKDSDLHAKNVINDLNLKNNEYLNNEIIKINSWADDKIQAIEMSVELMREQRKELRKKSDLSTNYIEKETIEDEISKLTKKIKNSWMLLAENEENLEIERKKMIDKIKRENMKKTYIENIFTVEFEVI